jgi:DNA-binding NarL/FixJ family response regulator
VHDGVGLYLEEAGFEVIHAHTGEEAVDLVDREQPDVVIMDIHMPQAELDGIEACRAIRDCYGAVPPVIVYTVAGDFNEQPWRPYAEAVMAGAAGYVDKGAKKKELVRAITLVAEGLAFFDPVRMQEAMLQWNEASCRDKRLDKLTRREEQVLALIQEGLTNKEISEELGITHHTVRNHVSSILNKLGLSRRGEAAGL